MSLTDAMDTNEKSRWFNPLVTRKALRVFEICDLDITPSWLISRCQSILTAEWSHRLPLLQPTSPAKLAASIISSTLSKLSTTSDSAPIVVIDPCAGGGGPTPTIEQIINSSRSESDAIEFKLSDLNPHLPAWRAAAAASAHLTFIPESVDAANPPPSTISSTANHRVFRLYALSFHHLDDSLATRVMGNTLETSHGFCILELQDRRVASLILMIGHFFLVLATSWLWYWRDPVAMILTYFMPVLPFMMAFDGAMSAMRTREFKEVLDLLPSEWTVEIEAGREKAVVRKGDVKWRIEGGRKMHTWPIGFANWITGVREHGKKSD